jgi:hypothetical protein
MQVDTVRMGKSLEAAAIGVNHVYVAASGAIRTENDLGPMR